MKKIIKNRIFIVIITLIIGVSGTLYATTKYQASEVLYNPSSGDSMTVNDALNEIYNIKKLGTATADDIIKGKTAVVQGELITGTARDTFLDDYTKVAEESTPISWDGTKGSKTATLTTTYTPTKDCNYIIFSYMTRPQYGITYSYDGSSGEPFPDDSIFKRIFSVEDSYSEKWSIRRGYAKAGETITAKTYGYATQTYQSLYNVIYTNENI